MNSRCVHSILSTSTEVCGGEGQREDGEQSLPRSPGSLPGTDGVGKGVWGKAFVDWNGKAGFSSVGCGLYEKLWARGSYMLLQPYAWRSLDVPPAASDLPCEGRVWRIPA